MLDQKTLDNYILEYKDYEGSAAFIVACTEAFKFRDGKFVKNFIDNFFRNNRVNNCLTGTFRGLIAHWNNIALDKLNMGDYKNFTYTCSTVTNLRIILHFMENNKVKE